jgi:hypothetical protein
VNLFNNIQSTIVELEQIIAELAHEFPVPQKVSFGDTFRCRHASSERSDILASFLKMVRVISLLNASVVLVKHGYAQETYILGRAIDEATEDVHFWGAQIGETGTSKNQMALLKDFYQELLTDSDDPLSISKRQPVQRAHIQEALSNIHDQDISEKVKRTARSIYRVFSGFAHGSYAAIMELYGRGFHLRGMRDTPRVDECIENFPNYVYRAILGLMVIASRVKRQDLLDRLVAIRIRFANETGCVDLE